MKKHNDIKKILFTPAEIQKGIKKLAKKISRNYAGEDLTLVSVLKGSVVFLSDLLRHIDIPCTVEFMAVSSYGEGAKSSGVVQLVMDLRENPKGRNVLLVEDILDTGLTMNYLLKNLRMRGPRTLKVCAFLDKPGNHMVKIRPDYACFSIPNHFVVGYGLDYNEHYRNLPYIGILKEQIYS